MSGQRPFELTPDDLKQRLEEMVDVTFSDLISEFLLMPMGSSFIKYPDFREAYEVLKRNVSMKMRHWLREFSVVNSRFP